MLQIKKDKLLIGLAMAGILFFSLGVLFLIVSSSQDNTQVEIISPSPSPESEAVIVHVSGAVRKPGVYRLSADGRVNDALVLAGGLSAEADRKWFQENVNLAEKVEDGTKLYLPFQGEEKPKDVAGTATVSKQGKTDLNDCTQADLEELPGIGPTTAKKILDYRNEHGSFSSKEDLMNISGIGEKTFAEIEDQITVY